MAQLATIQFHDQTILAIDAEGTHYVAMKPIVENIGLQWEAQLKRIQRHPVLSKGMSIMDTPSNGGVQRTYCLPVDMLNGWLFGVDVNRVRPELRPRLMQYQLECFGVLYAHFNKRQPEALPSTITPAQQQALQELVGKVVDSGKQGYAETWARFHRKFRVAKYNQLPIGQFDEAVAYLNAKLDGTPVHDADLVRVSAGQIITHAADMAGQLFAQAIKQAALNGSHIDRFVVEADYKARKVDMRLIKRDAYIMNDAEWLDHFKARVTHALAA